MSIKFLFLLLIQTLVHPVLAQLSSADSSEHSQVFSTLRKEFQKTNSLISYVELNDIRPLNAMPFHSFTKPNRYLVVARGMRSDQAFLGNFSEELFGIFLFDDSLFSVLHTIDIMPTRRWGDYAIHIVTIWKDSLTIHGEGIGYGDQAFDKKYPLNLKQP